MTTPHSTFVLLSGLGLLASVLFWVIESLLLKVTAQRYWKRELSSLTTMPRRYLLPLPPTALKLIERFVRMPLCASLTLLCLEKELPTIAATIGLAGVFYLRQSFSISNTKTRETALRWKHETGLWQPLQLPAKVFLNSLATNTLRKLNPVSRECLALYVAIIFILLFPFKALPNNSYAAIPVHDGVLTVIANCIFFFPFFHSSKVRFQKRTPLWRAPWMWLLTCTVGFFYAELYMLERAQRRQESHTAAMALLLCSFVFFVGICLLLSRRGKHNSKLTRARNYWLKHPSQQNGVLLLWLKFRESFEKKGLQAILQFSTYFDLALCFALLFHT